MKAITILNLILLLHLSASGQHRFVYHGTGSFLIEGAAFADSVRESPFDRFPSSYKTKVRGPVWDLSKCSAGISVRFFTNSTSISVRWELLKDLEMNHMAFTGIKGVDLYCKTKKGWQYINTGRPQGKSNEALLISNLKQEMKEFRIYLPLYDGVTKLEIGTDSLSMINRPEANRSRPIVFYGTSITQGGCASRTGMVHTSIISRQTGLGVINFGFSGNGRMEAPVAELMAAIDALFYVIDGTNNMSPDLIHSNAIPMVETIRKKQPLVPIVFVEELVDDRAYFDPENMKMIDAKNRALREEVKKMKEKGIKDIYYIENPDGKGLDHEATVDGVHLTDLGFSRYADFLLRKFHKLRLPINASN
jgi:hypothetical protein